MSHLYNFQSQCVRYGHLGHSNSVIAHDVCHLDLFRADTNILHITPSAVINAGSRLPHYFMVYDCTYFTILLSS